MQPRLKLDPPPLRAISSDIEFQSSGSENPAQSIQRSRAIQGYRLSGSLRAVSSMTRIGFPDPQFAADTLFCQGEPQS